MLFRSIRFNFNKRVIVSAAIVLLAVAVFVPSIQGKTLANVIIDYIDQTIKYDARITKPSSLVSTATVEHAASSPTEVPASPTQPLSTLTPTLTALPIFTATTTPSPVEPTQTPSLTTSVPLTYTIHVGEYPYCIARRLNINLDELLALNQLVNNKTFYAGTILQLPQTGNPFTGNRTLRTHPAIFTVSTARETIYQAACAFGDVDPLEIAQANNIPVDSDLFIGQQLNIP